MSNTSQTPESVPEYNLNNGRIVAHTQSSWTVEFNQELDSRLNFNEIQSILNDLTSKEKVPSVIAVPTGINNQIYIYTQAPAFNSKQLAVVRQVLTAHNLIIGQKPSTETMASAAKDIAAIVKGIKEKAATQAAPQGPQAAPQGPQAAPQGPQAAPQGPQATPQGPQAAPQRAPSVGLNSPEQQRTETFNRFFSNINKVQDIEDPDKLCSALGFNRIDLSIRAGFGAKYLEAVQKDIQDTLIVLSRFDSRAITAEQLVFIRRVITYFESNPYFYNINSSN